MRKITLDDVKNLHEYELIRDDWRKDVIAVKARRRVLLGDIMSLLFENRLTVLNQVQEMCRAERLAKPEAVQQEIDVYNDARPRRRASSRPRCSSRSRRRRGSSPSSTRSSASRRGGTSGSS